MAIEWIAFVLAVLAIWIGFAIWAWHKGFATFKRSPAARYQLWKALAVTVYLSGVAVLIAFAVQNWSQARVWVPWAAAGAALAGFAIWVWVEEGWPRLTTDPAGRMQLWKAAFLVVYLASFTVATTYSVYGLWQAEPQLPMEVPPNEPTCAAPPAGAAPAAPPAPTKPVIKNLDPSRLFLGTERTDIIVLGCGFQNGDQVRFTTADQKFEDRNATFDASQPSRLTVSLSTKDFRAPGTMKLKVVRPSAPGDESKELPLTIDSAARQTAPWQFLYWSPTISQELRLLLLVLFAGILGSCVYSLKSLADYIGNKNLNESWFTYYFIQPFKGAGIAIVFYFVVRGGFLAGANTDIKSVNIFGTCAIAALVGVFSDLALTKLREIFLTLFKPQDDRADKIGLSITTQSPLPDATIGVLYNQSLQVTGGKPPYTWEALTALPAWLSLNKDNGALTGTPVATPKATYKFKLTDSTGATTTTDLELTVKEAPAGPA